MRIISFFQEHAESSSSQSEVPVCFCSGCSVMVIFLAAIGLAGVTLDVFYERALLGGSECFFWGHFREASSDVRGTVEVFYQMPSLLNCSDSSWAGLRKRRPIHAGAGISGLRILYFFTIIGTQNGK